MKNTKKVEKEWPKETEDLIKIGREVLRLSRKMREEKSAPVKPTTPYEEAVKTNPYISKYNVVYR